MMQVVRRTCDSWSIKAVRRLTLVLCNFVLNDMRLCKLKGAWHEHFNL